MSDPSVTLSGRADPDSRARTHLANERTFLAWLRTGLGLMLVGIGAAQFLDLEQGLVPSLPGLRAVSEFATVLIVGGIATSVVGGIRYIRSREQIDEERFQPAGRSVVMAIILVAVVGGLALILASFLSHA